MPQDDFTSESTDMLFVPLPRAKQRVIDTINQLGRTVVPAEVVAQTGLPVHEATSLLNKIAAETYATLQVTEAGQIRYVFPQRFEGAYAVRGMERAFRQMFLTIFRLGFFVVRLSFGVMLILSMIVVVVLIIACIIAICCGSSDSGGGGDIGGDWGFFDIGSIGDGFSWNYTDSHQRKIEHYGVADRSWRPKEQIKKGNFFLECFSFLFGDGDPNPNSDEIKWKMIAEVIRSNNFVVTAEQIAPYTGVDPKNESGMFETLARFEGEPQVTDQGNIIYVFDSMRRQRMPAKGAALNVPRFFQENEWQFSEYPAPALLTVLTFASMNFLGSWWLFKHIATIALLQHFVILIDVLVGYGALFLLIPFIRIVFNAGMNNIIALSNQRREELAMALNTTEERAKIADARSHAAANRPAIESARVIYQTDMDSLEQQFET